MHNPGRTPNTKTDMVDRSRTDGKSVKSKGKVENLLKIQEIGEENQNSGLTCEADNGGTKIYTSLNLEMKRPKRQTNKNQLIDLITTEIQMNQEKGTELG